MDEVREADILLHVVDLAHPFHDNQIEIVTKTLQEIGAANIPTILILNKVDLYKKEHEINQEEMMGYYRQMGYEKVIFVSAATGENIVALKQMIFEEVKRKHLQLYPNFLKEGGYEFSPWPTE